MTDIQKTIRVNVIGDYLGTFLDIRDFRKLLDAKERNFVYPPHAISRALRRGFIDIPRDDIPIFEEDIRNNQPVVVYEQEPEGGERVIRVYYHDNIRGGFNEYILIINSQIRLKTLINTTKPLQEMIYRMTRSVLSDKKRLKK